ncbi:MAG: hypothetical protein M1404_07825 [Acidobacteria bacterium]|nr:hypothetical protein [Acidobacteriota bacterium]
MASARRYPGLLFLFIVVTGTLNAQNVSTYLRTDSPTARIEIDASRPASFRVPRTIYGTFLENIGHSIFGGVSAELLDNPSLENYDASLETIERRFPGKQFQYSSRIGLPLPWLPLWVKQGRRYEPRWGGAANSSRYLYLMGMAGQEVGIRQSVYLPVERELDYDGVLFVRSHEGQQELAVSFRRHDEPGTILALDKLQAPAAPGWHKLHFHLSLAKGAVAPFERVDFAVSISGNYRLSIDEIMLYPADAIDGFDPDVVRAAKALESPLLRYGGNFTSAYHWEEGIGPVDKRRTMLYQAWGIPDYNLFGTDELMKLCRLIGAQPQIALNLGSGTAEEARKWVQYCVAPADSPEGRIRAQKGHPAPYDVPVWEMGNELWNRDDNGWQTPSGNAVRYREFYNAIRSLLQPGSKVLATGGDIDFFRRWNAPLIQDDASELHYLTTHFVVGMDNVLNKAAGRNFVWSADFAVPVGVGRALSKVKAQIDSNPATRGRVKLAYTEWLFNGPQEALVPNCYNLGGAIITAGWMNMLIEHADFVPISDMTGLIEFGGIQKKLGKVYVTPQYWAFWLYTHYAGDTPVSTRTTVREYDVQGGVQRIPDISNVPWLDVLATTDSRTHKLSLFVVNRNWRDALAAEIQLNDFPEAATADVTTLTSDSILTENNEFHPDRVHPVSTQISASSGLIDYKFPPRSLTVLIFSRR